MMRRGVIKFFNKVKGFGFVTDTLDQDWFFPYGSLDAAYRNQECKPGDRVTFELVDCLDREKMAASIKREEEPHVEEPNLADSGR